MARLLPSGSTISEARRLLESSEAATLSRAEQLALVERLERAEAALNCAHQGQTDEQAGEFWEYVEHEGKTWHRCRDCGLLELWEGGSLICVRAGGVST